jgi:AAA domain-containing protein/DnaB helicase-like protein
MSSSAELQEYLGGNGATAPGGSVRSEQSVLGALLLGAPWHDVDILSPADFSRPDHVLIFGAIAHLAGAGIKADPVTVSERLQAIDSLDDAGGLAYLSTLARETPSSDNAADYARAVRERSDTRTAIGAVYKALEDAEGLDSAHILQALEQRLEPVRRRLSWRTTQRPTLDWKALESRPLPEREWIISHWLPAAHPVLFAGAGATGKTTVLQALGSCAALRREYLDWPGKERRVLMWACEDDIDELHRRQVAIAKWLDVKLSDFVDRFTLLSYDREEVELAALVDQRLTEAPMLRQLHEQIGDYRADLVLLDPISRIYGGNENDRHQVAQFMAMLSRAGATTKAAIVVVGHPGKAAGSEYSGSTAWEGAVRARLFLGRTLPDMTQDQDSEPADDDGVRYLCRRKANYSDRDWRRLQFRDGVMVPDPAPEARAASPRAGEEYACDVVARAVRKLASMPEYGVASSNSPKYLPRLARDYKLLERLSEKQFAATMRTMRTDGRLVTKQVGTYANRTPREALALPEDQV